MGKLDLNIDVAPWMEDRLILLTRVGSHSYGTSVEDSDEDYKGVCIPPVSYYLGLDSFKGYDSANGKNFKNTKDDIDINILHINKFVKSLIQGTPNDIEILFTRSEDIVKATDLGRKLIDNRHLFLSKRIKNRFAGYAKSQISRITKNKNRVNNSVGYDVKYALHAIRLLHSVIEILETGDYNTYRPERELLLDIRKEKYSFDEIVEMIATLDRQVIEAYKNSKLPEKPDYDKINELLIEINRNGLLL